MATADDEETTRKAAAIKIERPRRSRPRAARDIDWGPGDSGRRGRSPRQPHGVSATDDPPGPGTAVSERAKQQGDAYACSIDSCQYYEELLQRDDELSDDEIEVLLFHEDVCPSKRHTQAALEADLKLPPGALTQGSAEHGIPSPEERYAWMRGILAIEPYVSSPEFARDFGPAALQGEATQVEADDGVSEEPPESPPRSFGIRVLGGAQIAYWASLPHGEEERDGLVWMTRLDGGLAVEPDRPPSCLAALWRFVPYWKSFISLPCEAMSFFLLDGEVEWQDAYSRNTLRLRVGGSDNNFVSCSSIPATARSGPPRHLQPFRARQVGHGQAVGLALFYASNGLRFTTAPNGPTICFDVQEWTADRLAGEMEKLRKSVVLRPPVAGHIPLSEAELAESVLPFYDEGHPFRVRLARYDPRGRPVTASANGASALEVLVPLVGSVDLFWVEPSPVRDISPGRQESIIEPTVRLHEQARSASAANERFSDIVLFRGPAPVTVQSQGADDAVCLSVRCPSGL